MFVQIPNATKRMIFDQYFDSISGPSKNKSQKKKSIIFWPTPNKVVDFFEFGKNLEFNDPHRTKIG